MKKYLLVMAMATFLAMNSASPIIASAVEKETVDIKIKKVVNQCLYVGPGIEDEIIEMYTSSGWVWNEKDNQFERQVVYSNSDMVVNDEIVVTDSEGNAKVEVNDGDVIRIKSYDGQQEVSKEVDGVDELLINENIYVNDIIKKMDNLTVANDITDGETQKIGQNDKELPKKGDIVTCNRFNGPNGDGRYYKNKFSAKAIKNFFRSDCDRALSKYIYCFKDYLPDHSKRYCSLYSPSHYGKCSKLISHSTRYHRH